MNTERFVYVSYIASTPAKVWDALTRGELTREYWMHENISDWRPGSGWEHVTADGNRTVKLVGKVLESVPGRRLVLTWGELADAADTSKHSRVAIDIETVGGMVRVTVTHDQLSPDWHRKVSNGWPRVLCSLKSLLETGHPLDTWA